MQFTLHFRGGPRDGQTRTYEGDAPPKSAGAASEAMARCMYGFYKLDAHGADLRSATMVWKDLKK